MTRRGFTLLEVIVAIAIVLALVGSAFSFLFNLLDTRAQAQRIARQQVAAGAFIESLERDLATCLVGDPQHGAGVRGTATTLTLLSRAVPASAAMRGGADPVVFADLERTTYRFTAATGVIEAQRGVPNDELGDDTFHPLGDGIGEIRLRYHDGDDWVTRFDSVSAGRLPRAVEVSVWYALAPADDEAPATEGDEADAVDEPWLDEEAMLEPWDEDAFARDADAEDEGPAPDRRRVILVPDPEPDEQETDDEGFDEAMETPA